MSGLRGGCSVLEAEMLGVVSSDVAVGAASLDAELLGEQKKERNGDNRK
jgi:hypothetical protein